ncbi:hypothetical protein [Methylocystis sp. MitZ-2018]|uniref:hypothetical protein n=1 Tax=Methylosinus sporium TaxID=428 RepID=UPI000D5902B7|nr:hypothetical protein C5688_21110 [Methylocystis sp. MitZ-2018]
MKKLVLLAAAFTALIGSSALARDPVFVSPQQSHAFDILPPPPAADSATTKAELAELHRLESTRTESEAVAAKGTTRTKISFSSGE